MKRLWHRMDDMPIQLRALTAYTALAAVTLALLSVSTTDVKHTLYAIGLAADVVLLTWRDQRAWWLQVAGAVGLLVTSLILQGVLVVAMALTLIVLAIPSTRAWYRVSGPLAAA